MTIIIFSFVSLFLIDSLHNFSFIGDFFSFIGDFLAIIGINASHLMDWSRNNSLLVLMILLVGVPGYFLTWALLFIYAVMSCIPSPGGIGGISLSGSLKSGGHELFKVADK